MTGERYRWRDGALLRLASGDGLRSGQIGRGADSGALASPSALRTLEGALTRPGGRAYAQAPGRPVASPARFSAMNAGRSILVGAHDR
jgi:hypothetical protein